jgi:hypothetical protein
MRIFLFLFASPIWLYGQFAFQPDYTVPVRMNESLAQPWAGGLNSAQVNELDVTGDGTPDLVLFERTANKVLVYIAENKSYRFAPEYEYLFPADLQKFLLLRDFNGDGRNDIFTGHPFGIKVYINTTHATSTLSWNHFQFTTPGGGLSEVILTTGFSGKINVQMQADDVPSIGDMDADGDLDILTMNFGGSGQVEYHKNVGSLTAPNFVRLTQTWGNFTECGCGAFAFANATCPGNGRTRHAGGKFLLALDVNADATMDLLFSESECDKLYLLLNEGTNENALFTSAQVFPSAFVNGAYPTAYFLDSDFDGVKDVLVSPGVFARADEQTDFGQSLHLFKNTGSNNNLQLPAQPESLLQPTMIDVGENAVPAFFDYDYDGDQDMFVGTLGKLRSNGFAGSIYLFQNTGSAAQPSFELVTEDYEGLSQQALYNLKPQFVDMNADGKIDLAFTATSPQGSTSLYYLLNTSVTGLSLGSTVSHTSFGLLYNENIHLTDINRDASPDLLKGTASGAVEYWQHDGNTSTATWSLKSEAYLNLGATTLRQNPSVWVGDANADAKDDLILADQNGLLTMLSDYQGKDDFTSAEDKLILNTFTRQFENRTLGGSCWPVLVNIQGAPATLVVGNSLGGVQLFSPLGVTPMFGVYPNPVSATQALSVETTVDGLLQVVNTTGQVVAAMALYKGLSKVDLPKVSAGVYLLRFRGGGAYVQKRLVIGND